MTGSARTAIAAVIVLCITSGAMAQRIAQGARAAVDGSSGLVPGVKFQKLAPLPVTAQPDFMANSLPSVFLPVRPVRPPALNTVPTFQRSFVSHNRAWPYTMIGGDPARGHTTRIPVKIIAVSLELQNADLATTTEVPIAPFEQAFLNSPNFQPANYTSGAGIQFADAVQRAQFSSLMKNDWHTELGPVEIVGRVTIQVPRFVTVPVDVNGVPTPTVVRAYFRGVAADGSVFVELLDRYFNDRFFSTVVDAINAGGFDTGSLNLVLLPNTFLFSLEQGNDGPLTVGFHTFFFANTSPTPIWVAAYASWISPGIFIGSDFSDVTALSHEISEAVNDPFLTNAVPAWEFPGIPGSCVDLLETADPIEVLPHATVTVTINRRGDRLVYHPQNQAMLQWFQQKPQSDALGGAFSYPDTTALTGPANFFGQLACPVQ